MNNQATIAAELRSRSGTGAAREARRNAELALLPTPERQTRLAEVRKQIESLGDVNLGAIDEFRDLTAEEFDEFVAFARRDRFARHGVDEIS